MKAVCEALGVARSNISLRMPSIRRQAGLRSPLAKPLKRVWRPPAPDEGLVARIKAIIGDQPTYGSRRVWARQARGPRERPGGPNDSPAGSYIRDDRRPLTERWMLSQQEPFVRAEVLGREMGAHQSERAANSFVLLPPKDRTRPPCLIAKR
jgi:hypothetical protein